MARKPGLDDGTDIAPEGRAEEPSAGRAEPLGERAAPGQPGDRAAGTGGVGPDVAEDGAGVVATPGGVIGRDGDGLGGPGHDPGDGPDDGSLGVPDGMTRPARDDGPALAASGSVPPDPWRPRPSSGASAAAEASRVATPVLDKGADGPRAAGSGAGSGAGAASAAPASVAPPRRRGGFGALLLGGMIAAVLGAGAAWFAQDRLGLLPARTTPELEARLAALEARPLPDGAAVEALAARLDRVEAQVAALDESAGPIDLAPLRAEIAGAAQAAETRAAALEQRLAAVEARPAAPTGGQAPLGSLAAPQAAPPATTAAGPDASALRDAVLATLEPRLSGTEAAVTELRAGLDDLDARLGAAESASAAAVEEARAASAAATELETRATTAQARTRAATALAAAQAALDAGEPLEPALGQLRAAGVEVPEALSARAAEGVPTLAALRDDFPEAARAALSVARDDGLVGDGSGVVGFLREQLSVRSVTPRAGQDPDAVLSRAEAQLAQGNLSVALGEVEALPEPVRAAMDGWIAQARARADATAALDALREASAAPPTPAD
ncbi:COG4223 family protein [Rubellimicrobium aerolatum]|uniref:COG4223 family protein n=1 Tax=Rubellimicrobium aerolatum TaxID=490979 RepID=A0ABW0SA32_9RHOB|nr:hypothetical protein [Rubellimicrobium aerolatum]MBP1805115.1 putative coiled-coil protein SlyX [Rubellimicrobium aerolatum]